MEFIVVNHYVDDEDWWKFVTELTLLDPDTMASEGVEIPLPVQYKKAWVLERDSLMEWIRGLVEDPTGVPNILYKAVEDELITPPKSTTHDGEQIRVHALLKARIKAAATALEN